MTYIMPPQEQHQDLLLDEDIYKHIGLVSIAVAAAMYACEQLHAP